MSEDEIIERVEHFTNINVLYGKTYGFTTDDLKKYKQVFKGLLDLYNNLKQQLTELQAIEEEHKKENGELRKELEEYNKRGQTLYNLMNAKDTYMYKEICKNFVPKDKIQEKIDWYKIQQIKYIELDMLKDVIITNQKITLLEILLKGE